MVNIKHLGGKERSNHTSEHHEVQYEYRVSSIVSTETVSTEQIKIAAVYPFRRQNL